MEFYLPVFSSSTPKFAFQFPTGWNSTLPIIARWRSLSVSIPNGMEFYFCKSYFRGLDGFVSIPNGMEFYSSLAFLCSRCPKFQFPTGWNSTPLDWLNEDIKKRFNSQRDGILPFQRLPFWGERSLFQFPTGWNSTHTPDTLPRLDRVSIPNGMEFYSNLAYPHHSLRSFQFPTGWNSTYRQQNLPLLDGVSIPNGMEFYPRSSYFMPRGRVSIPNGMEFYLEISSSSKAILSFNSQRDGILLILQKLPLSINLFQFPTGWNSTLLNHRHRYCLRRFQFPTGWNSTQIQQIVIQKDEVSIPNGMEFYFAADRIGLSKQDVSIPNGMEFYGEVEIKFSDYGA